LMAALSTLTLHVLKKTDLVVTSMVAEAATVVVMVAATVAVHSVNVAGNTFYLKTTSVMRLFLFGENFHSIETAEK
jgi:hypothetical protein